MNAELVGVGTELLLGQIANTNAQRLSAALATAGIDVFFHTVVGDNVERAAGVISQAMKRADAVILTGGLGPTPDDVTREAVAAATSRPLRRDASLVTRIEGIFAGLGREMPPANLRQADLPEGAIAIDPEGTAPGFHMEVDGRHLYALPGVPWEMDAMLAKAVLPELAALAGAGTIVSRHVLVVGLGESATHELIADLVEAQSNPTIAYLAGGGQVRVRISARAATRAEAEAIIQPVEREVRARVGERALPGDHFTAEGALVALLRDRGASIATAESLTGGAIGAALTSVPGASEVFAGSLVCYSVAAKRDVAGVDEALLRDPGPVSAEVAAALAQAAREKFGTTVAVAATGAAGPDPHGGHPAGTVFVAAVTQERSETRRVIGYGDRGNVRALACTAALDLGRRLILPPAK